MTRHPARMAAMALLVAVGVGLGIAALSQLGAVDVDDPRPSLPPEVTLSPLPDVTASPTATPSPTPEPEVWLYTLSAGESLSDVAIRFGTTTDELLTLNPEYRDNEELVEAGGEVIVPCTPIAAAEDRC